MSFSIRRAASAKARSPSISPPSPPTYSTSEMIPRRARRFWRCLRGSAGLGDLVGAARSTICPFTSCRPTTISTGSESSSELPASTRLRRHSRMDRPQCRRRHLRPARQGAGCRRLARGARYGRSRDRADGDRAALLRPDRANHQESRSNHAGSVHGGHQQLGSSRRHARPQPDKGIRQSQRMAAGATP